MDRRDFLHAAVSTGAVAAAQAVGAAGAAHAAGDRGVAAGNARPAVPGLRSRGEDNPGAPARHRLRSLTARAITAAYLARIGELNRQGPELRAILETNPDALARAEALDQEREVRKTRGALAGVPILLKDNIATADRMTTTAGSLALAG